MLAKCFWAKEMTLDGNLNLWNICREPKRVNNKVNITNSVNLNLFSFLYSACLIDIKLYKVISITIYW